MIAQDNRCGEMTCNKRSGDVRRAACPSGTGAQPAGHRQAQPARRPTGLGSFLAGRIQALATLRRLMVSGESPESSDAERSDAERSDAERSDAERSDEAVATTNGATVTVPAIGTMADALVEKASARNAPARNALATAAAISSVRHQAPPTGRDWRRRHASRVSQASQPPRKRPANRLGRFDNLEQRRMCAWVGDDAVDMEGGGGSPVLDGGGSVPGALPTSYEGPVQAGGPLSQTLPGPFLAGETGFPFGTVIPVQLNSSAAPQPASPTGNPLGGPIGTQLGGPMGTQPFSQWKPGPQGANPAVPPSSGTPPVWQNSGNSGLVFPSFSPEALVQTFGNGGAPATPPPSPGPMPPSPTIAPKPVGDGVAPPANQGVTPPGGAPSTVAATATTAASAGAPSPFLKNGACAALPAFGGPEKYETSTQANADKLVGRPEFMSLNDNNNEGVLIGREMDNLWRVAHSQPFDENIDMPTPAKADSYFSDDSHLVWLEITSLRAYNRYIRLNGSSQTNVSTHPSVMSLGVAQTGSNSWTYSTGLGFSLGEELSAKASEIGVAASKSLQTEVSVSDTIEESVTVDRKFEYTVSPCDVLSLYNSYLVVELKVDYIFLEDTVGGELQGFTVKRGSEMVKSTMYSGISALAASEWEKMKNQ